jgi:mercuric reductase
LEGRARFISPHEVEANGQRFYGDRFIVAVGSTALPPPIPGIEQAGYITHIEALRNKEQPRQLLVIGAGPVALEFAQMFCHFGSTVTMVVRGNVLYKKTEPEISDALETYLIDEGIVIHKQTQITRLRVEGNQKIATLRSDFATFKTAIETCLNETHTQHKTALDSLLTLRFQNFKKAQFMPV